MNENNKKIDRIVVLVIGAKRISGVLKIELPKWKKRRKRKKERRRFFLSLALDWTNGGSSGIKNNV